MKNIILFVLGAIIIGCSACKKETEITRAAEYAALVGTWNIKSVTATFYNNNGTTQDTTYRVKGSIIFHDDEGGATALNDAEMPLTMLQLNAFSDLFLPTNVIGDNTFSYWYPDDEGRRLVFWNTHQTDSYRSIADMSRVGNEMVLVFYTKNPDYTPTNPTYPSMKKREVVVLTK